MKKINTILKKKEKEIITDAYKIALAKQDIAMDIIDSISKVFAEESPIKYKKEEIADKIFEEIKKINNEKIQEYIDADIENKPKLRLKIEKEVIKLIRLS